MFWRLFCLTIIVTLLFACEKIALFKTPHKQPVHSQTQIAVLAEKTFWNILHRGDYQQIHLVETLLTAAYLQNPNDPQLAAHLAFLHIWKITERKRLPNDDPLIVNEIILARKYFNDAVILNPNDARLFGFLGDSQLIEGKIFNDQRQQIKGYFTLQKAIHLWPEFNYFAAGYPMSTLDANSKQFKEALNWQWLTLDLCADAKVDRKNPDFSKYMRHEIQSGKKRACWNSWIAPHNFEGFFLNMGDMLVKSGDWQTAIIIYNNAKLNKQYALWPFKQMLENRIQQARANVFNFRQNNLRDVDKTIIFNSGFGCAVCHQEK